MRGSGQVLAFCRKHGYEELYGFIRSALMQEGIMPSSELLSEAREAVYAKDYALISEIWERSVGEPLIREYLSKVNLPEMEEHGIKKVSNYYLLNYLKRDNISSPAKEILIKVVTSSWEVPCTIQDPVNSIYDEDGSLDLNIRSCNQYMVDLIATYDHKASITLQDTYEVVFEATVDRGVETIRNYTGSSDPAFREGYKIVIELSSFIADLYKLKP